MLDKVSDPPSPSFLLRRASEDSVGGHSRTLCAAPLIFNQKNMSPEINSLGFAKGPITWNLFASLIVFAIVCFTSAFITHLPELNSLNWKMIVEARILVTTVSFVWFFCSASYYIAAFLSPEKKFFSLLLGVLMGLVLVLVFSFNPVLDLTRGPVKDEGKFSSFEVYEQFGSWCWHCLTSWATFETTDGKVYRFKTSGNQAAKWREEMEAVTVNETEVRIEALQYLGTLLKLETK